MRKVLLVLTVLALTAPCLAAVDVSCSVAGKTVTVSYEVTGGDPNLVRAFGIQIDVNNGGVISNIDVNETDYYIFPGSIDINSLGGVESWGSAVVDQTSSSFILEMGSLYDPCDPVHKIAPPSSGTVCTFDVAVPLTGCVVSISEDTARGSVVMEDGNSYETYSSCSMVYSECYPASMPDWAEWDLVGRPECWCYTRQCHGDADNVLESEKGKLDFWVGLLDLQILSAGWYKPDTDPNFSAFVCADFNHTAEAEKGIPYTFRVGLPDLQTLSTFWYGPNGGRPAPDPNCLD